ncbi:RNA polymerase-binding protein DksA [Hydrogenophaga sp.]|uniref:RNA polymerase-binding protein DksA n=1 Tax=Hydrogenophaga sp. TaxID=1904254 RepID=UPI00351D13E1
MTSQTKTPAAKAAAKPAPKAAAKTAKPVAKAAAPVPAKAPAKTKVAAKPVAPKAPAKSAATTTTPSTASAKVAKPPVNKPSDKTTPKAIAQSAVKAAASPVTASAAPATKTSSPAAKRPSGAPAPVVVEPTPRPLGKRAAKKVMMEQMTQAAVVPTHAPDAAKATFSNMNERAVMTPPVPSSIQKDPKRANNWKTLSVDQLTDLDIQAMPDSEYMSDLQLAYFRRKLSQLKADMLANAGETTEHLREDTVVVPDPADRATIEEEHALELRTRDRERKLLKKIEQAIVRIDAGDYGYCEETGEPIGVGRLMARPTASLSLEAQQRRELKQKMFGD